jgi:hypothetical protein
MAISASMCVRWSWSSRQPAGATSTAASRRTQASSGRFCSPEELGLLCPSLSGRAAQRATQQGAGEEESTVVIDFASSTTVGVSRRETVELEVVQERVRPFRHISLALLA